jgi:selenocysteine lyase/cysteine desulfurase
VPGRRIAEYLRQRYDAYVPGGGDRVRFSTHYYNTFEQVDRVLEALRQLAQEAA